MRTRLCTLVLALAVLGCSDSNAPKTINGTYPLINVNGDPLPALIDQSTGYSLEVTEGTISLGSNGSFTDSYTLRETVNGAVQPAVTIPCSGTWSRSGNNLTLQETQTTDCGDDATATWDGNNTLTVNWTSLGLPAVHRR